MGRDPSEDQGHPTPGAAQGWCPGIDMCHGVSSGAGGTVVVFGGGG